LPHPKLELRRPSAPLEASEVSIMLEQIRYHLCPVLAAVALAALGACKQRVAAPTGYVEVVGEPPRGAACEAALPGALRLEGVEASESLLVSVGDLCAGAPLRHALSPGLYTLSWHSAEQHDVLASREPSPLHGPSVVSLFPGQVTRVNVKVDAPRAADVSGATAATDVVNEQEPACSRSGAS
jgi:hypothetical protein